MGLDQYLEGEITVQPGSPLDVVVTEHVTEKDRAALADPEDYVYVSGWDFEGKSPSPFYEALVKVTGVTPHQGSPHFDIRPDQGGGYRVCPVVFYWRKTNSVHRWFVENVQGGVDEGQRSPVHPEMLMDLLERCEKVLADHALAPSLLPTQGGFFFGSTDYDEWYFTDLRETVDGLKKQITTLPPSTPLFYQASW